MAKENGLTSRIPHELRGSPDAYQPYFEKNFGLQPKDKFTLVLGQLKENCRMSTDNFAMKLGRVGDFRVLVAYNNHVDNGLQSLHAEITLPDKSQWMGTVSLHTMTGVAVPSFSEHGPDVEEGVEIDIHPNDPMVQGRAVFSMLSFVENIIPEMTEFTDAI